MEDLNIVERAVVKLALADTTIPGWLWLILYAVAVVTLVMDLYVWRPF